MHQKRKPLTNDSHKDGLVSIITPTHNCAHFICETIRSVQAQTYKNWEMIISDDCSTDNTQEVIAPYLAQDPRIKYIFNDRNCGAAVTRNHALRVAKGRWVAFLDSDDLWEPMKLEKQIRFMETNNIRFSYHDYIEIDENGKELGISISGKKRVGKFDMYACCWPGCLSVMYDSSYIGVIQISDIKKNNDSAMWLKVIQKADCILLKEKLARYRRRTGSITPLSIKEKIRWHYILFRHAEKKNALQALILTGMNIIGNTYKKVFYVKRYKV